jgi:hypothetical protein
MASKKSHQKVAAAQMNQTIRVQIDLPSFENPSSVNLHTPNSICLHINFDGKNSATPGLVQIVDSNRASARKCASSSRSQTKQTSLHDVSMCSLTSGYSTSSLHSSCSSSASSDSNSQYLSNQAFCLDTTKHDRPESLYVNESHLYDKLSYPSSVNNKPTRRFMNSTQSDYDEDEENTTAYSNGINFTQTELLAHRRVHNQHIYEDITNFSAVTKSSRSQDFYEQMGHFSAKSSHVKRLNSHETSLLTNTSISENYKPRKNVYKREYTVNEIFQNVKKFKEQAQEQETQNRTVQPVAKSEPKAEKKSTTTKQNNVSQFLTSEQIKSSVSIIKQIFELKSKNENKLADSSLLRSRGEALNRKANATVVESSAKPSVVDQSLSRQPAVPFKPKQHTYVNEKILQPIDV